MLQVEFDFLRIRNFGFLANRRRATLLPLCFQLLGTAKRTESRTRPLIRQRLPGPLALSQVWWPDDSRRETHGCRDPTSFPATGHHCRMKRPSRARILRASRRAPHLCALSQNKSLPPASSPHCPRSSCAVTNSRCHLPCSTAQSRRPSTPLSPLIQSP
jgi:hypothetical protein